MSPRESFFAPRRSSKRAVPKTLLIIFLGATIVGGVLYAVLKSNLLTVREIRFAGDVHNREAITQFIIDAKMASSRLARLVGSTHMLFWAFDLPQKVVLPTSLTSLAITPRYAERVVEIKAGERTPFGVWCGAASGSCFWFDGEGTLFAPAANPEGFLVPRVVSADEPPARMSAEMLGYIKELHALSALKVSGLFVKEDDFKELEASTFGGPSLLFSLKEKTERIDEILKKLAREMNLKKLAYIDFRVSGRIFYK